MCKIMIMPHIKKENIDKAWEFSKAMAPLLSKFNDDGFGYAAMDSSGKVFGERWLNNTHAMKEFSKGDIELYNLLGQDLIKEIMGYNNFGAFNKEDVVSIMLHARRATSPKGLPNTHPFIKSNTAIIHNGMIRNHEQLTKEFSTCDSETILHEYLDYTVNKDVSQIQGVVDNLEGYYAVGAMTVNDQDVPIVDVFKSATANLSCTYINELQSVIFCTDKDDAIEVIKKLGWHENKFFEFHDSGFIRFNALTGEKMHSEILQKTVIVPVNKPSWLERQKDLDNEENIINMYDKDDDIDYVAMINAEERKRTEEAIANHYSM